MIRLKRLVFHHLLHADDPPYRLAMGVALGVFIAFTPTVGIQMMLGAFFAWVLRANKAVAVAVVWISNPVTTVPMYYGCYKVGEAVVGSGGRDWAWWSELMKPPIGWWSGVVFYWERLWEVAVPLWTGSLITATILGVPTYFLCYYVIRIYRMRRWGQIMPPDTEATVRKTTIAPPAVVTPRDQVKL